MDNLPISPVYMNSTYGSCTLNNYLNNIPYRTEQGSIQYTLRGNILDMDITTANFGIFKIRNLQLKGLPKEIQYVKTNNNAILIYLIAIIAMYILYISW